MNLRSARRVLGATLFALGFLMITVEAHAAPCSAAACVETLEVDGKPVTEVNDVLVRTVDDTRDRKVQVKGGLTFAEGTTVEAPTRPRVRLVLVTRNGNRITLQPGARLRIEVASERGERFAQVLGETRFAVTRALSFFEVAHEKFLAAVKGTEFSVAIDDSQSEIRYGWVHGEVVIEHEVIVSVARGGGDDGDDDDAEETTFIEREVLSGEKRELRYRLGPREYLKTFKSFRDAEAFFREQLAQDEKSGDPRRVQMGLMGLGTILERIGKHKAALKVLNRALELARANGNEMQEGRIYRRLGFTYRSLEDYRQATAMHRRWLAIEERRGGGASLPMARAYFALGRTAGYAGDAKGWVEAVEKGLNLLRKIDPEEEKLFTAAGYKNLGDALWTAGDRAKAMQAHETSLAIKRKASPNGRSGPLANSLRDIGMQQIEMRDFAKGIDNLQKALDMRIALLGEPAPPVAMSLEDMGVAYIAAGDPKKALEWLGKALAMREQLYPGGVHRSIVRTYRQMALAAQVTGDNALAGNYEALAKKVLGALEK
jgi:tetratricopeptide (TPR) repeat protein